MLFFTLNSPKKTFSAEFSAFQRGIFCGERLFFCHRNVEHESTSVIFLNCIVFFMRNPFYHKKNMSG